MKMDIVMILMYAVFLVSDSNFNIYSELNARYVFVMRKIDRGRER